MKKLLLSLAAVTFCICGASAETVTFDATAQNYANQTEITSVTAGSATINFAKGTNSNPPKYYTSGAAIRAYGGNTITVSVPEGSLISEVEYTFGGSDGSNTISANVGTFTSPTWTGSSNSVVFTIGGTTGNRRIQKMAITYTLGEAPAVKSPKFDLVKSAEGYAVSITCDTEGAEIYYTSSMDGDAATPTKESTKYTGPVDVFFQTQFKAIAYVGDKASSVVPYTANPPYVLENFMPLLDFTGDAQVDVRGNIKAVYQNGDYLYVADTYNNGMLLYGNTDSKLENGNVIDGLTGTFTIYNGQTEIKNYELGAISAGTAVEPVTITLSDLDNSLLNRYVKIAGLTIENKSGASYTITDGDGATGLLYNKFTNANKYNVVDVPEGTGFTVIGFVGKNYDDIQLIPVSVEGGVVMEQVEAPQFTPESGELEAGTNITIVCPTEGATIYYTVDGTVPTAASTEYVSPIVFEDAMTVKAIAVKEGMLDSEVVSAVYTLYDPNAPVASVYTFDFTNPEKYNITIPSKAGAGTDLCEKGGKVTYTEGLVNLTIEAAEDAQNLPRLWWRNNNGTAAYDVRVYAGSTVTFTTNTESSLIEKIEFVQNTGATDWAAGNTYSPDTFVTTDNVWNGGSEDVAVKTFTMTPSAKTFFAKANVYVKTGTAVEMITDENAAPVYYNLQGVRVANPENGLYIEVKGNKSRKVIF